jgi:D-sedoheptulose 7-phosphate isomerase
MAHGLSPDRFIDPHVAAKDLVEGLRDRRYLFTECVLAPTQWVGLRQHADICRTFLVIAGTVKLEYFDEETPVTRAYRPLEGWHAPPGATFRFGNDGPEESVVLEAGMVPNGAQASLAVATVARPCIDVSAYEVAKPWGHEVWYTDNLDDPRYALKQIHMEAGHQSSLQSHERKAETNYVISGEATVLNGFPAPADRAAVIDIGQLPQAVYRPRSGWSSAPGILHRVIARSDYTSIEVSTPELDDVIRWADDTGRPSGRIDSEHAARSLAPHAEEIALYLAERRAISESFPVADVVATARAVFETYERGGTIYAMGNGGNAGTLDHVYCDFKHHPFVTEDKHAALPADVARLNFVNITGSPAELTGLVNDLGSDNMFADSLEPFLTDRDLVMAYSGSGNSPNVVRALEIARKRGARTFAMTKGSGGRCRELADICLIVPGTSRFPGQTGKNDNNFHFEDAMLSVNHILVGLLKARIAASAERTLAG